MIHHTNGFIRVLHQQSILFFTFPQGLFGLFARGDVQHHAYNMSHSTVLIAAHCLGKPLDRYPFPRFVFHADFDVVDR